VKYFNWNGYIAKLPPKNLFEFTNMDNFWKQIDALGVKRSKVKSLTSKTCSKAYAEAEFFKQYAENDRVKIFDEIITYNRLSKKSIDLRKSVDSALDSCRSPTPTSPPAETTSKSSDPIEQYLATMRQFDAMQALKPKVERKAQPKVVPQVQEEASKENVDDENRRKSMRVTTKKRKYDEMIDDEIEEVEPQQQQKKKQLVPVDAVSVINESPVVQPKPKKSKISKEETLEERFVINWDDPRFLFRNVTKKKICVECKTHTKEHTHRCHGSNSIKCSGWYHPSCASSYETKTEEIRHQTGDSDDIIQTITMSVLKCKSCSVGVKNCFACQQPIDNSDDVEETSHCPVPECKLSYHKTCLKFWPQNNINKINGGRQNQCPQHSCHTCFSKDIHTTGLIAKCIMCPAAYHTENSCTPAGTQVLSNVQIICPRHVTEHEKMKNVKEKQSKPLNLDWCNVCMDIGNLVCCESCPASFHPNCISYEVSDEKFICQECQDGRLTLYNTIVWARVGSYRWWPALVMPNFVLPDQVLKLQKHEREFALRFFGTYDYHWITCERCILYDGTNVTVKGGTSRLDFAFTKALSEAHEMSQLLDKEDLKNVIAKPRPYTKLSQNKPIPPVKLNSTIHEICNCSPEDSHPCGSESDCLNMILNMECNSTTCPAGVNCENQKLSKREYVDLKIIKTQNRGFGAICEKDIAPNTFVVEYVGELIDTAELNRRMAAKLKKKEKDFYFLTIEGDLYVDAGPAGNLARFINHSCSPNCDPRKIIVDGNTRIGIFSNQFIKAVSFVHWKSCLKISTSFFRALSLRSIIKWSLLVTRRQSVIVERPSVQVCCNVNVLIFGMLKHFAFQVSLEKS